MRSHPALFITRLLILLFFSLNSATHAFAQATVVVTTPVTINAANVATYQGTNLIVRGTTVTIDHSAAFPVLNVNSLQVDTNGTVTQVAANPYGVQINATTDVKLITGNILVNGLGNPAGTGAGAGQNGSVANDFRATGAGYGAQGGGGYRGDAITRGVSYGSITQPVDLGSGGGNYGGALGGTGGGAIKLTVGGICLIDGGSTVQALGGDSQNRAGGGSGGSIWITTQTFQGAGSLYVYGGLGNDSAGSGAAGRIALYYTTNTFTGDIHAGARDQYSQAYYVGGAGTVYLKPSGATAGDVVVDGWDGNNYTLQATTPIPASLAINLLTVRRTALVTMQGERTVGSLLAESRGAIRPVGGDTLEKRTLKLNVTGDATVRDRAEISASYLGYDQTTGPGAGVSGTTVDDIRAGGGAHGGQSGDGYRNPGSRGAPYDSTVEPIQPGSGGGLYGASLGGVGGGVIKLTVGGILKVEGDGNLQAYGADSNNRAGAGAGGSIWVTAHDLRGNGVIIANGGYGNDAGGAGSGGRIALYYDLNSFSGSIASRGRTDGDGNRAGAAGTIYAKSSAATLGSLTIDNGITNFVPVSETYLGDAGPVDVLTIKQGVRFVTGALTANSLVLDTYSYIIPPATPAAGSNLVLNIVGNATLTNNSQIQAAGGGYGAATGPGAGSNGIAATDHRGNGGAHGGSGGAGYQSPADGTNAYGSITQPTTSGSGGGNFTGSALHGGAGGGAIKLTVGGVLSITDACYLNTDANASDSQSGAGAGGSIWVTAGTISGSGGIVARGGYGNGSGGGGGGGRIALYYGTNSFTGGVLAYGGPGHNYGGAGTVYSKAISQTVGNLTIDDNYGGYNSAITPVPASLSTANLIARNGANILFDGAATLGNLTLDNYAVIRPAGSNVSLTVTGDANILNNSGVAVGGTGYAAGAGPGTGIDGTVTPNVYASGGAYGGNGGLGYSGTTVGIAYGSYSQPTDYGSGGGNYGGSGGGSGGGAIRFDVAGTLNVNGTGFLNADGGGGNSTGDGGGAGGSIWINAQSLVGTGAISAVGGGGSGGGGGGGRIALYYGSSTFTGGLSATSGSGYNGRAGAGTVYTKVGTANGDLLLDNGNSSLDQGITPLALPVPIRNLILRNGTQVVLTDPITVDSLSLINNSTLYPKGSNNRALATITVTTRGNLTMTANSRVRVAGYGYVGATGPGTGANGNPVGDHRAGGGGHGGRGGDGYQFPNSGGVVNDVLEQPIDLGSGGGNWNGIDNFGGAGGGAIRLIVNGTFNIADSRLEAFGADSNSQSGGGAGGSIWVTVNALTGNGSMSANGGYGNGYGGGGGGGRIAIYSVDATAFTGTVAVNGGGSSSQVGDVGTIYRQTVSAAYALDSFSLSANSVASGQALFGTVNLTGPAPAGGLPVTLTSSNTGAVTVPATVTVLEGATQATFSITVLAVSAVRTVTLTATAAGITRTATVIVQPWLSNLQLTPTSVSGGGLSSGVVRLAIPAPAGGLVLNLTSSDVGVTFPDGSTVTVPAGATISPSFRIQTPTVTTARAVTIQVGYLTERRTASLYISPAGPRLLTLSVSPSVVLGGRTAVGVVTLNGLAPAGGAFVSLSSNDPNIGVPAFVRVPTGRNSALFTINTQATSTVITGQITATLGAVVTRPLTVRAVGIIAFDLIPSSVQGGNSSVGVVTLETVSPTDVTVTISSNNGAATPDSTTIIIPAGQTVGVFTVNTTVVGSNVLATITVNANGTQKSRKLTITP